ncbi:CDP-glycerol glycerophosphotransferase, TagB/SpsB family [Modestobacter sp. DSM 44400]|uniref:CDP-glycerol glycerophosphotransferase family protein n=1 Tax=Modestobacter sp. DSM 44400 TaxID=1550230 RepID=UPI00089DA556|nr:CDP-glycerol glycerophosphotransferase family protein [Modestobacter sp. DSM 44400]SDY79554.1 CDP-glycerol glycerophosphotransferase, TagB/SpsB family [Modestobacter sp. DSM 44400]
MTVLLALLSRVVLFPLSFLVPRRRDLWVFGAPQDGFSGNPKFLFLWMSQHRPDVQCVWLTSSVDTCRLLRDRGLRCELRWSRAGVTAAARARYHVVANDSSDTSLAFSGGAQVLNLWHGVGIKNILRGARVGQNADLYRKLWRPDVYVRSAHRFRRPALVLATSPAMSAHFARSFDVPVDRCPPLGYPRIDPLVDEQFRARCLEFGDYAALRGLTAGRTVYLYAPTLRDDDADFFGEALPDLAALSEALRPTDGVLLLKLHPSTAAAVSEEVTAFDNIIEWPADLDLYPVLDEVDCLITDYSSLLYDYIATSGSGAVIYAYDYERYVAKNRDLAFPLEDNIVGQRADSFPQLCEVLRSGAALAELPAERLAELRTRFWGSPEAVSRPASPAIADFVLGRPGS